MEINLIHKKGVTEEEVMKQLEVLHKKYPDMYMSPEEWKAGNKEK